MIRKSNGSCLPPACSILPLSFTAVKDPVHSTHYWEEYMEQKQMHESTYSSWNMLEPPTDSCKNHRSVFKMHFIRRCANCSEWQAWNVLRSRCRVSLPSECLMKHGHSRMTMRPTLLLGVAGREALLPWAAWLGQT